jgi:hypothetical protein
MKIRINYDFQLFVNGALNSNLDLGRQMFMSPKARGITDTIYINTRSV